MLHSFRHLGNHGRFGNQLFQIAGTIGRAHRAGNRDNAVFPSWQYAPYFSIPPHHFQTNETDERTIDAGRAYLQDLSEFAACADYVQHVFTPSPFANAELTRLRANYITDGHHTAVHVRRGDYLNLSHTHAICPTHYFTQAIDEMRVRHPDTHFLIFSDDPHWCREHLGGDKDVTIIESDPSASTLDNEMADFLLMRSCQSFIISNSTFSWWAAYLSQSRDVICPERWFALGANVSARVEAFLPEFWQRRSIESIGPRRAQALLVSEGETGYIITDNSNHQIHHLNPSATLIFELCTGSNTNDDIANVMQTLFPDESWKNGLDSLISLGLVVATP